MAVQITQVAGAFFEARVTGTFAQTDQGALQDQTRALIAAGHRPRALIILDGFTGWERGAKWGDLSFMMGPGEQILRIAIVGDEKWRDDVQLFVAKGLRPTAIEFFPPGRLEAARSWAAGA